MLIEEKLALLRKEYVSATPEKRTFILRMVETLKRGQEWYKSKPTRQEAIVGMVEPVHKEFEEMQKLVLDTVT